MTRNWTSACARYIDAAAPLRKQPVNVRVKAREGEALETEWRVGKVGVTVCSPEALSAAENRALDVPFLSAQLGRLGNTPYELAAVELEMTGSPFAPASLLNQLRRQAVAQLQAGAGYEDRCARARGLRKGSAQARRPAPPEPL